MTHADKHLLYYTINTIVFMICINIIFIKKLRPIKHNWKNK